MSAPGPSRRVALLTPCYWPEVRRGTERFAHDLAAGLDRDGHRARLIAGYPGRRPSRAEEGGIEVIRVPRPLEGQLQRRGFEDYLGHLPLAAAALALSRSEVAHALYSTDAMVAARWTRRTGRPSVLSYMGIPDRPWLVRRRMRLKSTYESALGVSAVVALSQAAADGFRRELGIEARVINPGVDVDAFTPGPGRAEAPTIFSPAALDAPHKRAGELIEAFAALRRARPDARLVLARPRDPALADQVSRQSAGIEWADVDDRWELAAAYREAWVTALPSVAEAFGLVLAESMACGTPVVGRRAGAIPEVVDRDRVGVLYDGGPDELAAALAAGLDLAGDPGTPAACRARAEELSVRRCVQRYEQLYEELLAAA